MPTKRPQTLRALWLGEQLRALREAAGLTLKETGEYLQRDQSAVSRMESGVYPAKVPEVLAYVNLCGVGSVRRREDLVKLAQDAWQTGWWDGYAGDVAALLVDKTWLETRAAEVHTFQMAVVPGLLQTRDYASALIHAADADGDTDRIERWIEFRMNRQRILEQANPPRLTAVLEESILHRTVGGADVMRDQLLSLVDAATQPDVDIRVLRSNAGAHASPDGPFEVFAMTEPYADVGYVDTPAGAIYIEADRAERLTQTYGRLWDAAAGADESTVIVSAAAESLT